VSQAQSQAHAAIPPTAARETAPDFCKHGCPNCEELMQVRYPDRIQACTTTHLDGSWVARWQRYVRGMYAVRAELKSRGIKYRPRDQSDQD
ncbi:uncharacterized protein LAESUDRAFT_732292, partial [Laetiporus sulphureus 93-53]